MNLFVTMLAAGVLTSVHCVFMCGSMVLTYAVKGDAEGPLLKRVMPHIAYQGAKITSYMTVGLALGAIGSAFDVNGVRGWIQLAAGAFMLMLGLQMTGWVPFLRRFTLKPPKFLMNALMKVRKKAKADAAEGRESLTTPLAFGALTGLMPCAPLQTAQLAAASAGSAFAGAGAMLGFGLGTAPLMLGFGAVSGYLSGRFKEKLQIVAALVVMGLGLIMLNRGLMMVGSPVSFKTVKQAVIGGPAPAAEGDFARGEDGVVEIPLTIRNVRYEPESIQLPANEKVRLIVDRQEANVCSDQLWIPQLGVQAPLTPNGKTVIEIPASEAGTYNMTCQMGMMSGSVVVGGGAARSGGGALLPIGAIVLAGAGWYAYTRKRQGAVPQAPARKGSGGKGSAPKGAGARQATPASAEVAFGLTASELLVAVTAVVAAIIAGLTIGNFTG